MRDHIVTLNNQAQLRQNYGHPTYAVYYNLCPAFDSLDRSLLWLLLTSLGIPHKIVSLIRALYSNCVSWLHAIRVLGSHLNLDWVFAKGICWHQTLSMGVDWLLERVTGTFVTLSFPHTFAPKSESTIGGTFAPWNIRPESENNMEHSLPNAKSKTWSFRSPYFKCVFE